MTTKDYMKTGKGIMGAALVCAVLAGYGKYLTEECGEIVLRNENILIDSQPIVAASFPRASGEDRGGARDFGTL